MNVNGGLESNQHSPNHHTRRECVCVRERGGGGPRARARGKQQQHHHHHHQPAHHVVNPRRPQIRHSRIGSHLTCLSSQSVRQPEEGFHAGHIIAGSTACARTIWLSATITPARHGTNGSFSLGVWHFDVRGDRGPTAPTAVPLGKWEQRRKGGGGGPAQLPSGYPPPTRIHDRPATQRVSYGVHGGLNEIFWG